MSCLYIICIYMYYRYNNMEVQFQNANINLISTQGRVKKHLSKDIIKKIMENFLNKRTYQVLSWAYSRNPHTDTF